MLFIERQYKSTRNNAMGLSRKIITVIETQYPHQFLWSPVFFAFGIVLYFTLPFEPNTTLLISAAVTGLAGFLLLITRYSALCRLCALFMLILIGFSWAGGTAHRMSTPKIDGNYYGPVWGRVVKIDKSYSDKIRITLDTVTIPNLARTKTPERVRISLHDKSAPIKDTKKPMLIILPGDYIMATAHLLPPAGPVEPGGFDFSRHAWFLKLGGIGYTRIPVLKWREADNGMLFHLERWRVQIAHYIQTKIPNQEGQFASAILTGNRMGLNTDTVEALRQTNLSHMLAISGLHMGLVAGFVFALMRIILIALPVSEKYISSKKIAAIIAMLSALLYLYMSGASISTQRAYIMIVVVFVAVLIDRRAISLRSVALAAFIVLIIQPQSLLNPGFQMSFAATTALVVVFSSTLTTKTIHSKSLRLLRGVLSLTIASIAAGLATAPIAAAHFNQIAQYGLFANLLALPVMSGLVMPGGVIATLLSPIGLDEIGFFIMQIGIAWILLVANEIASWPNAVHLIITPPAPILALLYCGMLIVILWIGKARWMGCVLVILALSLWINTKRSAILVSEDLKLVGFLGSQGRSLNRKVGNKFTAQAWLENDADQAQQATAFTRPGMIRKDKYTEIFIGKHKIIHTENKQSTNAALSQCDEYLLIISTYQAQRVPSNCTIIDPQKALNIGAFSINHHDGELLIIGSINAHYPRLWSPNRNKYPPADLQKNTKWGF